MCYIIKPVVSPDWSLRQNSLAALWNIFCLRGEDLSTWLCVKYVLESMHSVSDCVSAFFLVLLCCLHYLPNTDSCPKVKQVLWKMGKSKLRDGRCFFLNYFPKELPLYLKASFCWLLYASCMLLMVVRSASWWQEQYGAFQGTEKGPRRLHRAIVLIPQRTETTGGEEDRARMVAHCLRHTVSLTVPTLHFQGAI